MAISAGTAPVIMREKDALTDPYKSITEAIGSGPFKFVAAEWNPGAKTVYVKNPDYVPRSDPPDGNAGAKIAKVDRVEWIVLPDPFTKSSAIQQRRGRHHRPIAERPDPGPGKEQGDRARPHLSISPRSAISGRTTSTRRSTTRRRGRRWRWRPTRRNISRAAFGDERWWRPCFSFFVCGSPNETEAGVGGRTSKPDLARARQLLKESGYNGEKVVLINTHEIASIGALGDVTANNLKKLGDQRRDRRHRLGHPGRAPRQEGPAGQGRLEPVPHDLGRRRACIRR